MIGSGELGLPIILGGQDGKLPLGLDDPKESTSSVNEDKGVSSSLGTSSGDTEASPDSRVAESKSSPGTPNAFKAPQNSSSRDKKQTQAEEGAVKESSPSKPPR